MDIGIVAYYLTIILGGLAIAGVVYSIMKNQDENIIQDKQPTKKQKKETTVERFENINIDVKNPNLVSALEMVIVRGIDRGTIQVDLELNEDQLELFGKKWNATVSTKKNVVAPEGEPEEGEWEKVV